MKLGSLKIKALVVILDTYHWIHFFKNLSIMLATRITPFPSITLFIDKHISFLFSLSSNNFANVIHRLRCPYPLELSPRQRIAIVFWNFRIKSKI